MKNKINMSSISNKINFIYGDECEKNTVGMIIFSDGTDYFFDEKFNNKMSNEEVEALLLRGAVIFKDGKYYRSTSFNERSVGLNDYGNVVVTYNTLNLVNPKDIAIGQYYRWSDGVLATRSDISSTGLIPCKAGDHFTPSVDGNSRGGNITFWNENLEFISGLDFNVLTSKTIYFTVPNNDKIAYFRISFYTTEKNVYMLNQGTYILPYSAYDNSPRFTYNFDIPVSGSNIDSMNKQIDIASNIHINYLYDETSNANYTLIRINKRKIDGTEQYPFVYCPTNVGTDITSTYIMMMQNQNFLVGINAGIFNTTTGKVDGVTIQKGEIINDAPATTHPNSKPLTIDNNGMLGYADYNATASDLLSKGIISAVCGFMPIIIDYDIVPSSEWNNVAHYVDNAQRQIIGQFNNGDYAILTTEGRGFANSDGWTVSEAQDICVKHGLKFAYLLDGGGSTETVVGSKHINSIYEGTSGRKVPSFIIFNGTNIF